jgi:predicted secreted hydrolase
MNRRYRTWLAWGLLVVAALVLGVGALAPSATPQAQAKLSGLGTGQGSFAQADGPRPLSFPADQGPHNDFQTEWWYYTGNLTTSDGRPFGFELTFFRRALQGPAERVARTSQWATDQVYLAHFTLSDIAGGQFHAFERFERGAAGLAGAQGNPWYSVWLQDWAVQQTGDKTYRLVAQQDAVKVNLALTDQKGLILEGDRGYSQKGPDPGQASYYVSQTRLSSTGTIEVGGQQYAVNGTGWMDHEFSTSTLGAGQVGWDWFSIQLDDGTEVMAYTLRRKDGSLDEYSRGTVVYADGSTRPLNKADFQTQVTATWKSPHSGGVYPAGWTLTIPSEGLTLRLRPRLADQELNLSFVYWEGAVQIEGEKNGARVTGSGYVELTGYAQSFTGQF